MPAFSSLRAPGHVARSSLARSTVVAALAGTVAGAHAAGGHFDVDDATVLDRGRCQVETWSSRAPSRHATLLHVGPACRWGALELGANIERAWPDAGSGVGPQLKWVVGDPRGSFGTGIVAGFSRLVRGGGTQEFAYVPVTWEVGPRLSINLNAGVDRLPRRAGSPRYGASIEFQLAPDWLVIAERIRINREATSRAGLRRALTEARSIDVGIAHSAASGGALVTLGLNVEFASP